MAVLISCEFCFQGQIFSVVKTGQYAPLYTTGQLPDPVCSRKTGWSMDITDLTKLRAGTSEFLFSTAGCCSQQHFAPGGIPSKFGGGLLFFERGKTERKTSTQWMEAT